MASTTQHFEADRQHAALALADARQYNVDVDRDGRKAEAIYKRLARASRAMRPWTTDGSAEQVQKAIWCVGEITSILSDKIGPASRREFVEQGDGGWRKILRRDVAKEKAAKLRVGGTAIYVGSNLGTIRTGDRVRVIRVIGTAARIVPATSAATSKRAMRTAFDLAGAGVDADFLVPE